MNDLIQEFRLWNLLWSRYDRDIDKNKPDSKEVFIKKLEKKYKITKI